MSLEAVILALASAVRPSTSLAAVYALLSTRRPRVLLAVFAACGFAVSTGFGVLVVAVLHGVNLPGGESRFTDIVDLVAGVAALGFASGIWFGSGMERVRRRRPREEPSWVARMLREPSLHVAGVVGVATHVPGLFYLVALNAIAADQPGFVAAVVEVVIYNAIWFSVPFAALVFARRRPDDARDLIDRINGWMRAHDQAILAAVFALVGAFLVVKGVSGLAD
jgi:Sap-like sulfolipid-1-addressing protein